MKRLRALAGGATFRVSLVAGAAAAAMALASVATASLSVATASLAGQNAWVAHIGNQTTVRYIPQCDTCGVADLRLEGTADPTQPAVGDSITWRLSVNDLNTGPALNVYVDVTLPANVELTSSSTDRGTGCAATSATTLHCSLDWLSDTAQFGHVILVTKVTASGDHTLTAVTGYSSVTGPVNDPNPADNTLTLTATTPSPPPPPEPPITLVLPAIGPAAIAPGPIAGKRVTVTFRVTQADTGAPLSQGTMTCHPSVAGKVITYTKQFKNGVAQLSFVVPRTAKGKQLKVELTIEANGGSNTRTATFRVR